MAFSTAARAEITVMMSGGFALAYQELLPQFESKTGVKVVTTSGASQGTGPTTIKAQLERGARPDVVILSREGLEELVAAGRIVGGTEVGLANTPLGAAVRAGEPKPEVSTVDALKESLMKARLVSMPGSTSGMFLRDDVFPKLGIADKISLKVVPRGIESTRMLAAGESSLALGPVSELVGQPGIDYVGPLPQEVQLVQEFTAAIVQGSPQVDEAKRLIAFMSSREAAAAVKKAGMEQVQSPR
jgi:molybdate transport system substrate-binding protein